MLWFICSNVMRFENIHLPETKLAAILISMFIRNVFLAYFHSENNQSCNSGLLRQVD